MGDCMNFPDTVDEYMEQYKMTDVRQVYSNGIEYVPIFRMKQWFEHEKDQPTIQPVATDTNDGDTISRQQAIDIERNATVDTNPSHFEAHQKFMQFMDDAEVSSFGRWQWANGFNTALTAVGIDLKKLPTAQPEPKEGHWIKHETPDGGEQYECSRCGVLWEFNDGTPEDNEAYFCPKCGKKMKGERQK